MSTDILKRRVGVYPNSWEQRERWEKEAKKHNIPLSKYLVYVIENGIQESSLNLEKENVTLKKNISSSNEEIKESKRELARVKKLLSIQEEELEEYRNRVFADKTFTGVRTFNVDMINILRSSSRAITNEGLLDKLDITPDEINSIKAISNQLEALQEYGLVKYTNKGWKWVK